MSNHGTPPVSLDFVAKVVEHLPTDVPDRLRRYWRENGAGLAAVLAKALTPKDSEFLVERKTESSSPCLWSPALTARSKSQVCFKRQTYASSTDQTPAGYLRRMSLPQEKMTGAQVLEFVRDVQLCHPKVWADERHACDLIGYGNACTLRGGEKLIFPGCTVGTSEGEGLYVVYYRGDRMDYYTPSLEVQILPDQRWSVVYLDPH